MKNITILLSTMFLATICVGQTEASDYNKWSVEFNVGQNKPNSPFAPGYFSTDPDTYFNFNGVEHLDLGVRYMFNPYFGAKLDFGYDVIKNQEGTASLPFETEQYRVGLQGVVNVSRLLKFESFTNRFGLLLHAGLQVSQLTPQLGANADVAEDNGGLMIGLTPQVRLSKRIALTADFTYLGNVRQHLSWDGSVSNTDNNLTGSLFNTSVGITVYLGKKDKHADWYVAAESVIMPEKYNDESLIKRINELERKHVDTDGDGVPDYIDLESNTAKGVAVDAQGRTLKAVVPAPVASVVANPAVYDRIIKDELNIMYYDLNKVEPNAFSKKNLPEVIDYLKANPSVTVVLKGYTDGLGSKEYNDKLAAKRVANLKKLITGYGIDARRISTDAIGIDPSLTTTGQAVPLARRVNIIVNN